MFVKHKAILPVAIALVLLLAGAAYEALATSYARRHGAPGRLVSAGGHREYIYCRGDGSYTTVLLTGLGDQSDVWRDLHAEIAKLTRTCVYDRGGLGWSDDARSPRNSARLSDELHLLLSNAGEKPPYILVAHSMSGYIARIFTTSHPREVAGVLLLDVSHPDQNQRESEASNADRERFIRQQRWWGRLAPFGITRMLGHCEFSSQDCARSYRTTVDEYQAFRDIDPEEVRASGALGGVSLVVLAHDPQLEIRKQPTEENKREEQVELQLQQENSLLSSRHCFAVATGSNHYVQDARPDLVLKSLGLLLRSARESGFDLDAACLSLDPK